MYIKAVREFYIPQGARKVAHKQSQAVAYLYERDGNPHAVAFYGKAAKPVWRYRFRDEEQRERKIAGLFAHYQAYEQRKAEQRAARQARGRGLEVGDVLSAMWGYEQTNIDYYQVTALIGDKMVEVRKIAAAAEETQWLQGKTVPLVDNFVSEPMRRLAKDGRVKIDDVRSASRVEPLARIGDKAVYPAAHYTAYH